MGGREFKVKGEREEGGVGEINQVRRFSYLCAFFTNDLLTIYFSLVTVLLCFLGGRERAKERWG